MAIVAITSYEAIIELFVKEADATADRFSMESFNKLLRGGQFG